MKPAQAIHLAGGTQAHLQAVFKAGRFEISKQAISLWVRKGVLPPRRELQLRRLRPWWFRRRNGMVKNPKPRQPPANLASAPGIRKVRKGGAAKKKPTIGPPFRPKTYGDPETQI